MVCAPEDGRFPTRFHLVWLATVGISLLKTHFHFCLHDCLERWSKFLLRTRGHRAPLLITAESEERIYGEPKDWSCAWKSVGVRCQKYVCFFDGYCKYLKECIKMFLNHKAQILAELPGSPRKNPSIQSMPKLFARRQTSCTTQYAPCQLKLAGVASVDSAWVRTC